MDEKVATRLRQRKAGRCSQCGRIIPLDVFICESCGVVLCVSCVRVEGFKFYCLDCWQARWLDR